MSIETLIRQLRAELDDGGLRGSFLVRDLATGREISIDPDLEFPSASLAKVPLALVTLDRIRRGELDGATPVDVQPGRSTVPGPAGLTKFRHPARVAIDDLLYLSVAVSDSSATDALFALTPATEVTRQLRDWGITGIAIRHNTGDLVETPAERFDPTEVHFAHSLAIGAATEGRGHAIPQLDVTRASSGSARAYVNLLAAIWCPSTIEESVAARVRELMADNVFRQRLAPDFSSDATHWASKTGTVLNLRHEAGVVTHADGSRYAVAALTESRVPAAVQPEAEVLMARVARLLRDHLRSVR